jgi:hypothetical protein
MNSHHIGGYQLDGRQSFALQPHLNAIIFYTRAYSAFVVPLPWFSIREPVAAVNAVRVRVCVASHLHRVPVPVGRSCVGDVTAGFAGCAWEREKRLRREKAFHYAPAVVYSILPPAACTRLLALYCTPAQFNYTTGSYSVFYFLHSTDIAGLAVFSVANMPRA